MPKHTRAVSALIAALAEAKEWVRHEPTCAGLGYRDEDCDCGAVEYLDRAEAALIAAEEDAS